jgi:hypothetical protein
MSGNGQSDFGKAHEGRIAPPVRLDRQRFLANGHQRDCVAIFEAQLIHKCFWQPNGKAVAPFRHVHGALLYIRNRHVYPDLVSTRRQGLRGFAATLGQTRQYGDIIIRLGIDMDFGVEEKDLRSRWFGHLNGNLL